MGLNFKPSALGRILALLSSLLLGVSTWAETRPGCLEPWVDELLAKNFEGQLKYRSHAKFGNPKINSSAEIKRMGREFSIELKPGEGFASAYVYGSPYRKNGQWQIDYAIWTDASRKAVDVDAKVLRSMDLDRFMDIALADFKQTYFRGKPRFATGQVVMLPSARSGLRKQMLDAYRIEESFGYKFKLRSLDGKTRYASDRELFLHNFFFEDGELEVFAEIMEAGGRGKIVQYDGTQDAGQYAGYYMILDRLPSAEQLSERTRKMALFDPRTRADLERIQKRGLPLLLSIQGKGIQAAMVPENNQLSRFIHHRAPGEIPKAPGLVVTPVTRYDTIAHELKHVDDTKDLGGLPRQLEALSKGMTAAQERQLMQTYTFLVEQRAYSRQLEALSGNETPERFAELAGEAIEIFSDLYPAPVKDLLDGLKASRHPAYAGLVEVLKRHMAGRRELAFETLFPGHP